MTRPDLIKILEGKVTEILARLHDKKLSSKEWEAKEFLEKFIKALEA